MSDDVHKLCERLRALGLDTQPVTIQKLSAAVRMAEEEGWTAQQVCDALELLHPEIADETHKPEA